MARAAKLPLEVVRSRSRRRPSRRPSGGSVQVLETLTDPVSGTICSCAIRPVPSTCGTRSLSPGFCERPWTSWPLPAGVRLTRPLFGAMLRRIEALPVPAKWPDRNRPQAFERPKAPPRRPDGLKTGGGQAVPAARQPPSSAICGGTAQTLTVYAGWKSIDRLEPLPGSVLDRLNKPHPTTCGKAPRVSCIQFEFRDSRRQ